VFGTSIRRANDLLAGEGRHWCYSNKAVGVRWVMNIEAVNAVTNSHGGLDGALVLGMGLIWVYLILSAVHGFL